MQTVYSGLIMVPQEVIENIPGLTREKLSYYVNKGYINPEKEKRGSNYFNVFSKEDFLVIKRAFSYIKQFGSQPRIAFEKARKDLKEPNLNL